MFLPRHLEVLEYGDDMNFEENRFQSIFDRVNKTSRNRYISSRRLLAHHHWSYATIALLSLTLIFLSLSAGQQPSGNASPAGSVLISIAILVYSIVLNLRDFNLRADKHHRCGIELSTLKQRIYPYVKEDGGDELYERFIVDYETILSRYENHEPVDNGLMQCQLRKYYDLKRHNVAARHLRYWLQFWHYLVVLSITGFYVWLHV